MTEAAPATTVLSYLAHHARDRPGAPAYCYKVDDAWVTTSWQGYHAEVRRVARALIALGLTPGGTVGVLGFNRPEWNLTALGTMAAGGAPAGIYTTNAPPQVGYILAHAEARVVVVEDLDQWRKVEAVRDDLPQLAKAVLMRGATPPDDPLAIGWEDFLAFGDGVPERDLDARLAALRADQQATLIYTSGTTGPPKAVMLSHSNLTETVDISIGLTTTGPGDSLLSYLPLAHIAEQMFSIHLALFSGYTVYFAEAPTAVVANLQEVQPTLIFGVPRVWERIHAGVAEKLAAASALRRTLAEWALGVGRRAAALRNRGAQPGGWLAFQERLAARLVHDKVKARLGFGRVRIAVSGAAPIARDVLEFFAGLGIIIHEVYGQSEGCGPTSWNRPGRTQFGTVGPPLPKVEVRISEEGEVLLRGPNVFMGYLKDEAATAETLQDGWLHSGDLGHIDEEGFLVITGRKKELIITSGGKNVAPNNIEAALKEQDLVAEAVVIGDGRRFIAALLTLEDEAARRFATTQGIPEDAALHTRPEIIAAVQEGVDGVNSRLARVEQVRAFRILPRNLSIEEGELTPTLKLKRRVIHERYAEVIEEIYA